MNKQNLNGIYYKCKRHPKNGGNCKYVLCEVLHKMEVEEPDDRCLLDWIRSGLCHVCGWYKRLIGRKNKCPQIKRRKQ